jgi:hypothetical protein
VQDITRNLAQRFQVECSLADLAQGQLANGLLNILAGLEGGLDLRFRRGWLRLACRLYRSS